MAPVPLRSGKREFETERPRRGLAEGLNERLELEKASLSRVARGINVGWRRDDGEAERGRKSSSGANCRGSEGSGEEDSIVISAAWDRRERGLHGRATTARTAWR